MRAVLLSWILVLAAATPAAAQPAEASRGQLLYSLHCIECHTAQMHWRAQRRARDWSSLQAQVQRWQGEARLQWSEADVDAVARYLNDSIYRFARPDAAQPAASLRSVRQHPA